MHLVFLNQYYAPDVAPTGLMLEAVVGRLVDEGHEVTVICAKGGYGTTGVEVGEVAREAGSREAVVRIRSTKFGRGTFVGKLTDYLSYYLGAAMVLAMRGPRPDRVIAMTTPPYLSVIARAFSKFRGADHAHWVMDLYPDVMVSHGILAKGSWVGRLLSSLGRWGFGGERNAGVMTLGPDMAERCIRYLPGKEGLISWVPLWAGGERIVSDADAWDIGVAELRARRGWAADEMVVMYSGNMGLGHRFEEILGAALRLAESKMRFVFFGEGRRKKEIEEFSRNHPQCRIEIYGYAPAESLPIHLRSSDVHLVSLATEWTGTMVPSKLQGIFGAGRPAIFVGDGRSSIGRWIAESGGGWTVSPGEVDTLVGALAEALKKEERNNRGCLAKRYAGIHFDRDINSTKIVKWLEKGGGR